jgi:hypothetical protein
MPGAGHMWVDCSEANLDPSPVSSAVLLVHRSLFCCRSPNQLCSTWFESLLFLDFGLRFLHDGLSDLKALVSGSQQARYAMVGRNERKSLPSLLVLMWSLIVPPFACFVMRPPDFHLLWSRSQSKVPDLPQFPPFRAVCRWARIRHQTTVPKAFSSASTFKDGSVSQLC